jgi:cysteinyl-tRNA synthetase
MEKKSLVTGLVLGILTATTMGAYAANNGAGSEKGFEGKEGRYHAQRMEKDVRKNPEEFEKFLENRDYEGFVRFVKEKRGENAPEPSKDHFDLMVAIYEARKEGDEEKLSDLKEEMREERQDRMEDMRERRDQRKEALKDENYDAFLNLLPEDKAEDMTQAIFNLMVAKHQAMEDKDLEKAKELREEIKELGWESKDKEKMRHSQEKRGAKRDQK